MEPWEAVWVLWGEDCSKNMCKMRHYYLPLVHQFSWPWTTQDQTQARPKSTPRESQTVVPPGVICSSGTGHQHQMMFRDILWLLWQRREWTDPWGWISGWYLQPGIRIPYFLMLHLSCHSLRLFPSGAWKVSSQLPNTGAHEGFAVSRDLASPVYFRQHFSSTKQQMNTAVPCWAPLPLPGWAVPYLKTANGKDFHIQHRGAGRMGQVDSQDPH